MTGPTPEYQAKVYRERAATARERAETMPESKARQTLLETAELWERMADWEEKNSTRPF